MPDAPQTIDAVALSIIGAGCLVVLMPLGWRAIPMLLAAALGWAYIWRLFALAMRGQRQAEQKQAAKDARASDG